MSRTLLILGIVLSMLGVPAHADEDAPAAQPKPQAVEVFERDEELRRLAKRLTTHRTNEQLAKLTLDTLLETKTEKHPKVMAARNAFTHAQGETAKALTTYNDARKARGLAATSQLPTLPAGDQRLVEARAEVELSRARLRMLMDRRAVVEDELKSLQDSKTDRHPKVRSALVRKAKLDAQVADVQARIAREQEHVEWLKRKRDAGAPNSTKTLGARIDALSEDVQSLRAELAEIKALLKQALAK